MTSSITVVSQNVRGLNNPVKCKRMYSHLLKLHPNILILQETHLNSDKFPIFNSRRFPQQFQSLGTTKSKGVAILISPKTCFTNSTVMADDKGRYLYVSGLLDTKQVTIAALYAPN